MILKKDKGNVLGLVAICLALASIYVGIVLAQTSTVAQNTRRAAQYQGAQAAAAGAVDYAYAVWLRKVAAKHSLLTSSDLALSGTPSFPGFDYVVGTGSNDGSLKIQALDKWGCVISNTNTRPAMIVGSVNNYPGWWGRTYTYIATAKLRASGDPNAPAVGVRRMFHYTEVPLFQCMYFFQDDLEIYNPASMILSGRIHSNENLYLSTKSGSTNLQIQGMASCSGTYSSSEPDSVKGTTSEQTSKDYPPYWSAGGTSVQLQQGVPEMSVMGTNFDAVFSNTTYTLGTGSANVSGSYHELIEPASSGPDPISDQRLSNITANTNSQTGDTGGLIIYITGTSFTADSIEVTSLDSTTRMPTVTSSTYSVHIGVGAGASVTNAAALKAALVSSTGGVLSKKMAQSGSSTLSGTAKLYDNRQDGYMNVVDVNVSGLQSAISSNVSNFSNIIYIYDNSNSTNYTVTSSTSWSGVVTTSTTTYASQNAVRLLNGATLSSDLTIASPNPVYIQGDYNSGGTTTYKTDVPANVSNSNNDQQNYKTGYTLKATSVIADSVTLLSNAWQDSQSTTTTPTAKNTTYNVALLGGYLPSDSVASDYYSGGAINYPRFLEGWSGIYCTYFGSMVELFPSVSKKPWIMPGTTGAYYSAPSRRFNFDTNFSTTSPPGSTSAVVLSRGIWSKW